MMKTNITISLDDLFTTKSFILHSCPPSCSLSSFLCNFFKMTYLQQKSFVLPSCPSPLSVLMQNICEYLQYLIIF
ncbi:hypothetical protein G9A89_004162 [Geosiphon pyriformis]|nr:hypothetical protein G9A89_004162 [Geosiphon pyriformis]